MTNALGGMIATMADFNRKEEEREIPRWKYSGVILYKGKGREVTVTLGSVVSHLSLQDWAMMHDYRIDDLHAPIRRPALDRERTQLF